MANTRDRAAARDEAAWARQGYQAMDSREMVDDVDQWLAGR